MLRSRTLLWTLVLVGLASSIANIDDAKYPRVSFFDIGLPDLEDADELSNHIDTTLDDFINPEYNEPANTDYPAMKDINEIPHEEEATTLEEREPEEEVEQSEEDEDNDDFDVSYSRWVRRRGNHQHKKNRPHSRKPGLRGPPMMPSGQEAAYNIRRKMAGDDDEDADRAGRLGVGPNFGRYRQQTRRRFHAVFADKPPRNRFRAFMDPQSFAGRWDDEAMDEKFNFVCSRLIMREGMGMNFRREQGIRRRTYSLPQRVEMVSDCCLMNDVNRKSCFGRVRHNRINNMCTAFGNVTVTNPAARHRLSPYWLRTLKGNCCPLAEADRYTCFNQSWTTMYARWQRLGWTKEQPRHLKGRPGARTNGELERISDADIEEVSVEEVEPYEERVPTADSTQTRRRQRNPKLKGVMRQEKRTLKIACCRMGQDAGQPVASNRWAKCRQAARRYANPQKLRVACKVTFKKCCIKSSIVSNPPAMLTKHIADFDPVEEVDNVDSGIDLETMLLIEEEDETEANEEVLVPFNAADLRAPFDFPF